MSPILILKLPLRVSAFIWALCLVLVYTRAHAQTAEQPFVTTPPIAQYSTGDYVYFLDWNAQGDLLAASTANGVYMFDENLAIVTIIHNGIPTYGVGWSPLENLFAVTSGNDIQIWRIDTETGSTVLEHTLEGSEEQVAVYWSSQGTRIASIQGNLRDYYYRLATIQIWSTTNWTSERVLDGTFLIEPFDYTLANSDPFEPIPLQNRLSWHPSDDNLLMRAGFNIEVLQNGMPQGVNHSVYIYDVQTGSRLSDFVMDSVTAVDWHPNGAWFTTSANTGSFWAYDVVTGERINHIGVGSPSRLVEWSPNGRYIATGPELYDAVRGERLGFYLSASGWTTTTWHPDGNHLTVGSRDGTIQHYAGAAFSQFISSPPMDDAG